MYQRFGASAAEEITEIGEKYDESIMANECRGFLDLDDVTFPDVDDGLRALEISHAMLISSRENRVVDVSRGTQEE